MERPTSGYQDEAGSALAFKRVVCGIDASPESFEAAGQAVAIAAEDARLWGVSAWDPALAMHAGIHAGEVAADFRRERAKALSRVLDAYPGLQPMSMRGRVVAGLLAALSSVQADLVGVGSHGTSRIAGVLLGSVATAMIHHAPCSALIARRTGAQSFPATILHAGDGSPDSSDAARVAGRIAAHHGAKLVTLHVRDGEELGGEIAEDAVALLESSGSKPEARVEQGSPPQRIVEMANEIGASLIVVGSRGVTGLRSFGSVSERVAHQASCSVLIVRRPSHPSLDGDAS